jgi:hypothetical protein
MLKQSSLDVMRKDSVEGSTAEVCLKCKIIKDISTENTDEYDMYTLG